ncbi:MAG: tRNA (guanine(26)-N(2))-dimethyltransferase [Halobacteriaceae archaeon]
MEVSEGGVTVTVPEQPDAGRGDVVFFNPDMELNRDLTIATLRAFRDREPGVATYLDAMAATGIRGVRAAADGWDATLIDVDPDAVDRCEANVARNDLAATVERRDANVYLHAERGPDVVDLDPFGTPIPFADAAFANTRHLVCVTATDTAPLCGAHFQSGIRSYSAVPRNTEYHAEMGLRILLSALVRTAARYDVGVEPVFSHVSDHYVRTYLTVERGARRADAAIDELGYIHHCPACLARNHGHGLIADPPSVCPSCGSDQVLSAGPVWLASPHDPDFVADIGSHLDESMGTNRRADRLLERIAGEVAVPTHYDQHRLTDRWGEPAPPMDEFLAAIRDAGYDASRTHYGGTTFKTDADLAAIEAATRPA